MFKASLISLSMMMIGQTSLAGKKVWSDFETEVLSLWQEVEEVSQQVRRESEDGHYQRILPMVTLEGDTKVKNNVFEAWSAYIPKSYKRTHEDGKATKIFFQHLVKDHSEGEDTSESDIEKNQDRLEAVGEAITDLIDSYKAQTYLYESPYNQTKPYYSNRMYLIIKVDGDHMMALHTGWEMD